MRSSIPQPIIESLENYFRDNDPSFQIVNFSHTSGGCINTAGAIETSIGKLFIKWNNKDKFPGMFETEAKGLDILINTNVLSIPKPLYVGEGASFSFLITEHIATGSRTKNYWESLGYNLAALHRNSASKFGLDHDNYIGSIAQKNNWTIDWINFFISHRLNILLEMALQNGKLSGIHAQKFFILFERLSDLLPTNESPALIHGDLWSGNLMTGPKGEPVLVDPAVYYGNREAEIAFTQMFGGFDSKFYAAYDEAWPLPGGFKNRVELYNLYPLLVHVNLFGGGYISQLESTLNKFQ